MTEPGGEYDTEHHKRACLARWVCNLPTPQARRDFLDRLERRKGAAFADDIRARVNAEWSQKRANRIAIPADR